MFEVNIYIETSLKGPGERKGWYAAVVEFAKKSGESVTREDFVFEEKTTYHKSVLGALIKALERLNTSCNLIIFTDSEFVHQSVEKHLPRWKENGFLNVKGEPIKNQEEWKEVSKLLSGHKVEFCITKRHFYSDWMRNEAKNREVEE